MNSEEQKPWLETLKECLLKLNAKTASLNLSLDGYMLSMQDGGIPGNHSKHQSFAHNAQSLISSCKQLTTEFERFNDLLCGKQPAAKEYKDQTVIQSSKKQKDEPLLEMKMYHSDDETESEDDTSLDLTENDIKTQSYLTPRHQAVGKMLAVPPAPTSYDSGEETPDELDTPVRAGDGKPLALVSSDVEGSDKDNDFDSFWLDNTETGQTDATILDLGGKERECRQSGPDKSTTSTDQAHHEAKVEDLVDFDDDDNYLNQSLHEIEAKESRLDSKVSENESLVPCDNVDNASDLIERSGSYIIAQDDCPRPMNSHIEKLKHFFGFGNFRPFQWKIIRTVLEDRRDQCVVMATGSGKSLCYQFPSLYTGGLTLVVSPLISLMEDQVRALSLANIPAAYLGSAQNKAHVVHDGLARGEYRLLYVSPEYLVKGTGLLKGLNKGPVKLSLVAVDEAHCVSQWGHDFRSAYRDLDCIRTEVPDVPIMALTATATPLVREDICKALKLKNPSIVCTGFDRPNLYFEVRHKSSSVEADIKPLLVEEITDRKKTYNFPGSSIVYCPTKKQTETVCSCLQGMGVSCDVYHAGLGLAVRKNVHNKFLRDELQCIVATVAFGMGIDKPDIRTVVHYGSPKDIESYYQEVGRAGRDGLKSNCYAFYRDGDFALNRQFLSDISNPKFKEYKLKMMRRAEQYLMTAKCRRRMLLSHFEASIDDSIGGSEDCCDNCKRRASLPNGKSCTDGIQGDQENLGKEAVTLMNAIQMTGGHYGLGMPISVLRGSNAQKIPPAFVKSDLHGSGKHLAQEYWKALGRQLLNEGYLSETAVVGGFGSTINLSSTGREWLSRSKTKDAPELLLTPNRELSAQMKRKEATSWLQNTNPVAPQMTRRVLNSEARPNAWVHVSQPIQVLLNPDLQHTVNTTETSQEEKIEGLLYRELIILRRRIADGLDAAPHFVATNRHLSDIAKQRPTNPRSLLMIDGISENIASRFGHEFNQCVATFCRMHNLKSDLCQAEMEIQKKTDNVVLLRTIASPLSLTETVKTSLDFNRSKLPLDSIAKLRILVPDTILSHLATALLSGYPVSYSQLSLTDEHIRSVVRVVRSSTIRSDITNVKQIKELLPQNITFGRLKFVLAMMEVTFGVKGGEESEAPDGARTSEASLMRTLSTPDHRQNSYELPSAEADESFNARSASLDGNGSVSQSAKRKVPLWMTNTDQRPKMYKRSSSTKKSFF